jgi:hypothetical protein
MVSYYSDTIGETSMKRTSKSYRLQLIKETVEKRERRSCGNPMALYIDDMLTAQPDIEQSMNAKQQFVGHHYDEHINGWVSDQWK